MGNAVGMRTTRQITQGEASISEASQGLAAARHIAQRSITYWEAGSRDARRSKKKTGALAGSGHIATRGRAAGSFTVAGITAGQLAAGRFTAGLLAIVQEPGMVLTAAGQAENIPTAHIHRAEGNGGGRRNMTGISEGSQAVVSRAVVVPRHSEISRAGSG